MQTLLRSTQWFSLILLSALPASAVYFARKGYLESPAAETLPVILAVLREAGQRVQADLKGTASLLADKLGIPPAVLERSEARTHYHSLLPITPANDTMPAPATFAS